MGDARGQHGALAFEGPTRDDADEPIVDGFVGLCCVGEGHEHALQVHVFGDGVVCQRNG